MFRLLLFSLVLPLFANAHVLRIGTRPSALAVVQAEAFAKALLVDDDSDLSRVVRVLEPLIVPIAADGDSKGGVQDVPLALRGVDFTGALDAALSKGEIDVAVHSLKDIPPQHRWHRGGGRGGDDEFTITYPLPREDPADILLGAYQSLQEIPSGSKIGTSSIRRQAQLFAICKDGIQVVNVRGNVDARLRALEEGSVDALILARSGVNRLKLDIPFTRISPDEMLPGLCQGIVAAVVVSSSAAGFEYGGVGSVGVGWMEDHDAKIAASAERAFLNSLDASSPWEGRPPLAGLMERSSSSSDDGGMWVFRGLLARPDGAQVLRVRKEISCGDCCSIREAEILGEQAGLEILAQAGPHFYD
jgi:hydroxymethylbilane synthase